MSNRSRIEQLLHQLYAARVDGKLEPLCALFSENAQFRIAGTSDGKPIAISARGMREIRPWLSTLVKTFRLSEHEIVSLVIDADRAAVHWRAAIHSKITGAVVATEFVDLVSTDQDRILSYTEFFVPS